MKDFSLRPSNRVDFTSLFSLQGYEVESIVGTTYCLNYETLLMLVLAVTYGPGANQALEHNTTEISPPAIFAAIKNMRGRLKVYCQVDKTEMNLAGVNKNEDIQHIKALLDEFIEPVPVIQIQNDFSSFHPKIWHIFFKPASGSNKKWGKQRFIVTSRNLTSNQDFDAVAVFDFFGGEKDKSQKLNTTEFHLNKFPVKGMTINAEVIKSCHSVISPFLDGKLLEDLKKETDVKLNNIFSLRSEIDKKIWKHHAELLDRYDFYCFNPALELQDDDSHHSSIHAKLYISKNFIILGSSNFTYRGWNHNREFNVQLQLSSEIEISDEDLLKQLGKDDKGNFGSGLFIPYTPPNDSCEIKDDDPNDNLQLLASVILSAEWDGKSLSLKIDNKLNADLSQVSWKPFFLAGEWEKGAELSWQMKPADVSGIFLCKIGDREIQMLAALKDNTERLWDTRYAAERGKISLSEELDYRILMAENSSGLYGRDVPLKGNHGHSNNSHSIPHPPVFERLLKMDEKQLEKFFSEPLAERENDPRGLVQAFKELESFFGFKRQDMKK